MRYKIKKKFINFFISLHYSDIEPFLLWIGIIFYLVDEYFGDSIPGLNKWDLTPIFVIAVFKLTLTKIDKLSTNDDTYVGYLSDIIDKCMKRKIKCEKIRIFSYDSQGFYHGILGKDFFAEEICVMMHKNAYEDNAEILQRWNLLIEKKKTNKITLKLHDYDRFGYGMTFDMRLGVFGSFKPKCIVEQSILASTLNTYYCTSKMGETCRQIIFDFNLVFDSIYENASEIVL